MKLLAAAALVVMGAHAQASILFSNTGQTSVVNYSTVYSGATLQATVQYTLSSWTSTTATFAVLATNTTASNQVGTNRVVSFGIGVITPTLIGANDNSGAWDTSVNSNFPGFQQVDFCAFVGNNCSGGAGGGLAEGGGSVSFNTTMTFSADPRTGISFASPFTIKYQSAGSTGRSVEFSGCASTDADCGGTPPTEVNDVPEPGSLALAGIALFGVLATSRTRRRA